MISLLLSLLPLWQDVQTTSINAETRRTEVIYYASREDALSNSFRESENYLDLGGEWDFKYFEDYHSMAIPSQWDRINVPGNWEVQGWGTPIYVNHPYEFAPAGAEPPQLPATFPGALYHRTFSVPWTGREVYLNLCGVKSGTYVYVNGMEIGYCEDSKDLARFNITDARKEGENDLLLKVYRFSAGSYLECQDFWRISGIERDVYLSSEVSHSGFDFSVVSTLDESLQNGIFKLRMKSEEPVKVFYELLDKDGSAVADAVYEFKGGLVSVEDVIPGVRLWSAETPELYTLLLKVNG
jgi:beta-galactosidase